MHLAKGSNMQYDNYNNLATPKTLLTLETIMLNTWSMVENSMQPQMFTQGHEAVHSCSGHNEVSTKVAEALPDHVRRQRLSHAVM